MKFSKIAQVYASLISVFVLAVIGFGGYMWQSGLFTSQADEIVKPTSLPIISLETQKTSLGLNENLEITISGDFETAPMTSGEIILSYSNDLIDIDSINSEDGILGSPISQIIDEEKGTISLAYSSLTGIATTGPIAVIKAKTKNPGTAMVAIEIEPSLNIKASTRFTTLESVDATPIVFGASLVIK